MASGPSAEPSRAVFVRGTGQLVLVSNSFLKLRTPEYAPTPSKHRSLVEYSIAALQTTLDDASSSGMLTLPPLCLLTVEARIVVRP